MKPAVLSQATDKAEALWHHREMGNFKTFKLEREGEKAINKQGKQYNYQSRKKSRQKVIKLDYGSLYVN